MVLSSVGDRSRELSRTVGHGALAATLLAIVLPRSTSGPRGSCVCRSCPALMPGVGGWLLTLGEVVRG